MVAIHLEEPEFWAHSGFSQAFQREWQIYYNEPWQRPDSSCDAQYRASKLKYYLYRRALDRLCSAMKEYALVKYNRPVRFYVATHSLINYAEWGIVSPESSLVDLPGVDGCIAQVWTGTARTPNVYQGRAAERTFESAFLEYGVMQELVRGMGRRMWFLHDPVEDDPKHTWDDYRANYIRTLVASLLQPEVCHYEVAPWPSRVMLGPVSAGKPRCQENRRRLRHRAGGGLQPASRHGSEPTILGESHRRRGRARWPIPPCSSGPSRPSARERRHARRSHAADAKRSPSFVGIFRHGDALGEARDSRPRRCNWTTWFAFPAIWTATRCSC